MLWDTFLSFFVERVRNITTRNFGTVNDWMDPKITVVDAEAHILAAA
jgi:hypothetical protein